MASGDLSHKLTDDGPYGFSPDGPIFEKQVTEAMANADFLKFLTFESEFCDSAAECGFAFLYDNGWSACLQDVKAELLSHEGPFGVGYGVAAFEVGGDNPARNFDVQLQEYEKKKMAGIKNNEYLCTTCKILSGDLCKERKDGKALYRPGRIKI